ncbi:ABC transporter substrate-binding protein [Pseudarthrobacter sp. LMD1-1-1.1]|uniref:ABC transporter substrate-binding protein n=1 Tax=Pseudarthrobacter sp. LMD1-1-1.1 TaxID=3135242 RepID=UPI0034469256
MKKFTVPRGSARVLLAGAIGAAMLLSGCASSGGAKAAGAGGKDLCSEGAITIGSAKALSGAFSFYDTAGNNGEQLAVDQVNSNGGINGCPVKLITKDTKSDPAVGSQVARELIREGAQVLLPPADSGLGTPAAKAAQSQGIFSMAGASGDDYAPGVGKLFATGGSMAGQNGKTAAAFAKEQGYDSVYYATLDAFQYFTVNEDSFKKDAGLKELGRSVVKLGQTDFAAVISDIKRSVGAGSKPMIFLATAYPDAPTLITQLRKAGVDTPVVGNATWSTRNMLKALDGNTAGVFYSGGAYTEGDDASPAALEFVTNYKAKTGAYPENHQAQETYWSVLALFDAIKTANSVDGAAIEKALFAQKDLQLPMRTIKKWENGQSLGSTVIVGFTPSGQFQQVKTYNLTGEG